MNENVVYLPTYTASSALIIGINTYQHAPILGYAVHDAQAVADVLEQRHGFKKENITLLIDEDATGEAIKRIFLSYSNNTGPDNRLFIFFAGHGHTQRGKRGDVGYLVPVDGDPDKLETLIRWDEFTRNADLIPAKHIFFVMDACYSGLALMRGPASGSMRFLGDMLRRYGRQVLTAGKADEAVADGNGARANHSIFTSHLLDALEGASATKEGVITANGVMAYVYNRVASDQYSRQTPHHGFVEGDGDFVFDMSPLETAKAMNESAAEGRGGTKTGEVDILIKSVPESEVAADFGSETARTVKSLLSEPSKKIALEDYVDQHVRRFLAATDSLSFPMQGSNLQKEDFVERLKKYEATTKDLQEIVILLAKWGDQNQVLLLEKIFIRLAETDKGSSGLTIWRHLSWYPLQILMYSVGVSALSAKNYPALISILSTSVQANEFGSKKVPLVVIVGSNMSDLSDNFKWIPGFEKNYVPRSEYLFKTLQPILEDNLFLGKSYESIFDIFEILHTLTYAHVSSTGWGPPGRFAWKQGSMDEDSPFNQLLSEVGRQKDGWGPIRAGLFEGSSTTFIKNAEKYRNERLSKLHWY